MAETMGREIASMSTAREAGLRAPRLRLLPRLGVAGRGSVADGDGCSRCRSVASL